MWPLIGWRNCYVVVDWLAVGLDKVTVLDVLVLVSDHVDIERVALLTRDSLKPSNLNDVEISSSLTQKMA